MFDDKDMIDINALRALLNKLIDYLASIDAGGYSLIDKSLRVLNNSDLQGVKNIESNLNSAFRMMADNGLYGGKEDKIIADIYKIIDDNVLFHK